MDGVHTIFTCDQFPVQAEGEVDGDKFYFRARHGEWSFGIASNPADDPVDVHLGMAEGYLEEGEYDDTGYVTLDEAQQWIDAGAKAYRAWKTRAWR